MSHPRSAFGAAPARRAARGPAKPVARRLPGSSVTAPPSRRSS